MPFVTAVVSQLARVMDVDDAESAQRVELLADLVTEIVMAVESGETGLAVPDLAADPLLLATFFQNIDLLYSHSYEHADALSMLTLEAIHHAVEAEGNLGD